MTSSEPAPDAPAAPVRNLLRFANFRRLWIADALSQIGTRISALAVPLLAVGTLHASTMEVALLRTFQTLPYLLIGLQVGAWCDRIRNRPVLIAADLIRAAALATIPISAAFGVLSLVQVYVAVFVTGVLAVFFDVAHQSYMPRLVDREALIEGNAKLKFNTSVAGLAAPTAAGYLVQGVTAAGTVLVDALSYLWSAAWLFRIRAPEPAPARPIAGSTLRRDIHAGLTLVFGSPALRAISLNNATSALFQSAQTAVIIVFLVRTIHLEAGTIGLLSTLGLAGAVVGSLVSRRLAARVGGGRLLWTASIANGATFLLYPLTGPGAGLAWYVAAVFLTSLSTVVTIVVQVSYQQALCPHHLLGRMNATMNFLYFGAAPIGGLLGGALASAIGLRATLWVVAAGMLAAAGWLVFSPIRRTTELPSHLAPAPAAGEENSDPGR